MKVVFWSPMHGQSASTSNVLMVSLLTGIYGRKKCLLTQTHFNYNNLEAPLVQSNAKSNSDYFMDVGLDALVKRFKAERISQSIIEDCCITLPNTNISLLPGTIKSNREDFDDEIGMIAPSLIRELDLHYDFIFVDTSPSKNELSSKLMEDASLVVVNLSQNIGILDMFFQLFRPFIKSKIFYLFGAYDHNSIYNINNIRRKYKEITIANSGVIPYNTGFKDAQMDGRVVELVRKNLNCNKVNKNYDFMVKSIASTDKIMKLACRKQVGRKRS